ncbi:hypothetical protein YW5DRAFT_04624 [Streptomyces sp. Ncost-T6T-1]|uniref:hypothetical protein n=1 Tax=Streptomyces sp. Ncost-T6T-1 TaxID=1100828 RepID=UPI0008057A66|nr:hypothetical protein [Streptomyces sp. Ncost-T6T-1]SBU94106.1 hypothetical protein YW5DRAFT_04624 [Streptomyces sp. Ncost-T6T-1]
MRAVEYGDISLAVMHHPSRAAMIPKLLEACAPLDARVVPDPDPTGPPSPLRTAKRAWSAVNPEATHHVVIQDDVHPCPDFADHLRSVIQLRPDRAIALYVNWNSPENSYLSRRAVTLGSSWAPLSPLEYTPTLGLVLPAEWARQLGSYLFELPDSLRDDDEMVARFCRERGIAVIAALPTLLDHGDGSSLAGNETHGERRSVLFAGDLARGAARWNPVHPAEPELVRRRDRSTTTEFVVELVNSTCRLRFTRPGAGEAVDHLYGWYWQDWTELIGVDRCRVRAAWEEFVGEERSAADVWDDEYAYEVWAAGYLLGVDVACDGFPGRAEASSDPVVLRNTLKAWVESGLTLSDRDARGPAGIATLVDIVSAAVDRGAATDGLMEEPRGRTAEAATAFQGDAVHADADRDIDNALRAMADREADGCLMLAPSVDVPTPLLHMRVEKCPECGADRDTLRLHSTAVPTRVAALLAADEEPSGPGNVLTLLGCEVLSSRALLPAVLTEPAPGGRLLFKTRAAALTELTGSPVVASADLAKVVPAMASMEQGGVRAALADASQVADDRGFVVLPALTRLNPSAPTGGGSRGPAVAHPLTPHADAPSLRSLGRTYRTYLLDAVRSRLG